jgi:hypothetical protein
MLDLTFLDQILRLERLYGQAEIRSEYDLIARQL